MIARWNRPSRPVRRAFLLLLLGSVLVGCARRTQPDTRPETSTPEPGIYHVDTGERLSEEALFSRLADATYVVVGEQHTSRWQHRVQAKIYRSLLEESGESFALGMEMFQRPFQEPLDAYVRGEVDEETMLKRTEWKSRWRLDPELYRPLWRTARGHGMPVVALNVRRELSSEIARVGLDGLSEDKRERLPANIVTSIQTQRRYVRRAFERHDAAQKMNFEYFLQAQATWDETMAATAIDALQTREGIAGMVVVAGRAHARRDFGIPRRLVRRLGRDAREKVVSLLPYRRDDESFPGIDKAPADYVWLR